MRLIFGGNRQFCATNSNQMLSKPARKIGPSNRSITGKRSSQKTNRSQHFESALERDYLLLLEWDETVEDYGVQPLTIYYENNGRATRYTPDVVVYYLPEIKRKPVLIEIKYEAELLEKQDHYAARFKAADEYAAYNGYEFRIVTDKMIRTDYLYNLKFLNGYQRPPIEDAFAQEILMLFSTKKLSPIQLPVSEDQHKNGRLLYTLWQLVATKALVFDMQQKLTMNTQLWIP